MNDPFFPSGARTADSTSFDLGLRAHMQSVFSYMAGGLGLTGLVAYVVANSPELLGAVITLKWLVILAPLGIAMYMNFRLQTARLGTLQTMFWVFCAIMGMSMATLFMIYTQASIANTFFITGATFGGMALIGYTTKRDLTSMGSFMAMGLLGLIIASFVNMFMHSAMLHWVTSVIGVLIFTGLTAFDTQRIKQIYAESWGGDANARLAVMGALQLYLDFINMFVYLLQFMGVSRRD